MPILFLVGAFWHQFMSAVSSNIVFSILMCSVYGYVLTYCLQPFKVSLYHQVKA
ncbi:L-alanine exporter AlaE [Escherichia coli]|uniref:L-alanine exporter AlaE n=1 Tax=Escherichia coli TaxID=562 RepID=UPI00098AD161